MQILALATVLAALVAAVWRVINPAPSQRAAGLIVAALVLLATVQAAIEGFFWQLAPAYALIGLLGLLAVARPPARGVGRIVAALGLAAFAAAAAAPPLAFAFVPAIPEPAGPLRVGSQTFRLIDPSRDEPATPDSGDRRNVVIQVWHPAIQEAQGAPPAYIDGLGRLPDQVTLLPGFIVEANRRTRAPAVERAPSLASADGWPVVIFSPGYGAPRAFYTGLAADLASRGYVVLALDHPFESAVVELADGRLALPALDLPGGEAALQRSMAAQQDVRAADIRFALDWLGADAPLALRAAADLSRVAAAGHSFGGAAAALAALRDDRIGAAVNVDGTLYGDLAQQSLQVPFLLLESDHRETGHGDRYLQGADTLIRNSAAPVWRYQLERANHYSFTDASAYFTPPGRWLLAQVMGGSRGSAATQRASVDILHGFLREALSAEVARTEAAAADQDQIVGGRSGQAADR
jgi:predicted dienelactone hydrolase